MSATLVGRGGSDDCRWYEISGDGTWASHRWVFSTEATRAICNRPELLGWSYTDALRRGVAQAMAAAPFRDLIDATPERLLCVLNVLRGGLNFGLRDALHDALGVTLHASAFMSSQRVLDDTGWQIREDSYRKLSILPDSVLLVGDVVATGATAAHGLSVLFDHLVATDTPIRGLVFFTIGGPAVEAVVEGFGRRCASAFPHFAGCHVVYVEGRFAVAQDATDPPLSLPGTDLLRRDAILAPEFELSQCDAPSHCLERCTIYDAGARAFDVTEYLNDVIGYWQGLYDLATAGTGLTELVGMRWPERPRRSGEPAAVFARLQEARARWRSTLERLGSGSSGLKDLCRQRLETLQRIAEGP